MTAYAASERLHAAALPGSPSTLHAPDTPDAARVSSGRTPDQEFYGKYYQRLRTLSWRFEIALETYLLTRDQNEREIVSSWKTRIKTAESMRSKLIARGLEPTRENAVFAVHDAAGARVICPLVDDIDRVVELISGMPEFRVIDDKDYVRDPKPSGYRSRHLILEPSDASVLDRASLADGAGEATGAGEPRCGGRGDAEVGDAHAGFPADDSNGNREGSPGKAAKATHASTPAPTCSHAEGRDEHHGICLEVQLRTIAMDSWASIEHELRYKKDLLDSEYLAAELKRCADEMAATDLSLQIIADQIHAAGEAQGD